MPHQPTAPQTTVIPERLAAEPYGTVSRWLAANGIREWLPRDPRLVIDEAAKAITYDSFLWIGGERGFNVEYIGDVDGTATTDLRTVPYLSPITPQVMAAIEQVNAHGEGAFAVTVR
jgi:hypothetical protein